MIPKISYNHSTLEKYIVACIKPANAPSLLGDIWRSSLLEKNNENVDGIKSDKETMDKDCFTLSWLVELIQ